MIPKRKPSTTSITPPPPLKREQDVDLSASSPFKHRTLDRTQASIRLLHLAPGLSPEGLIQCIISHSTIPEASYACLSYRWGEPKPSHRISVHGQPFEVGQTLFDFLDMFRQDTRSEKEPLWIDALCIDQDRVQERNHQVAQMGRIYSSASVVYVWLGKSPAVAPVARSLANWETPSFADLDLRRFEVLRAYLYNNEYWTRAWISQEIILAREVVFFLDSEPIGMRHLLPSMRSYYVLTGDKAQRVPFEQYTGFMDGETSLVGMELIDLMHHFRENRCRVPQDRVFSLLSLCSVSSRVPVDYEMSLVDVARSILAQCSLALCLCDVVIVLHTLGLTGSCADSVR